MLRGIGLEPERRCDKQSPSDELANFLKE
jgi:hypothetical protein